MSCGSSSDVWERTDSAALQSMFLRYCVLVRSSSSIPITTRVIASFSASITSGSRACFPISDLVGSDDGGVVRGGRVPGAVGDTVHTGETIRAAAVHGLFARDRPGGVDDFNTG